MRRLLALFLLLAYLQCVGYVYAGQSWLEVFDQEGDNIGRFVVLKGAEYQLFNYTHLLVWCGRPVKVDVYLRDVLVYSLTLEPGRLYRVKVKAEPLRLYLPRDVYVKVTILATGEVIEADSFRSTLVELGEVPYGLLRIEVKGVSEFEEVVNWQGGIVTVGERVEIKPSAIPILAVSGLPALLSVYAWRRRRPAWSAKLKRRRPVMSMSYASPEILVPYRPKPKRRPRREPVRREPPVIKKVKQKTPKPKVRRSLLTIADIIDMVNLES